MPVSSRRRGMSPVPSSVRISEANRKMPFRLEVVKRLDAHRIASDEKAISPRIPDRKREHTAKFSEAMFAPTSVGLQGDFGVGFACEGDAFVLKLRPNFAKVIDLAVVHDAVSVRGILHGLMPVRREIENREASIAQTDFDGRWTG